MKKKQTTFTCGAAAIADQTIATIGAWEVAADSLRHSVITETLDDTLTFQMVGSECHIVMGSATDKRIAVVVRVDGRPIPLALAGTDVRHGEGQSYLLVDKVRPYSIYKSEKDVAVVMGIATRSNKLVCKQIIVHGENE